MYNLELYNKKLSFQRGHVTCLCKIRHGSRADVGGTRRRAAPLCAACDWGRPTSHCAASRPTERQNHARDLVREADLSQWDALVIMSGDGLLFEVGDRARAGARRVMLRLIWERRRVTMLCVRLCGTNAAKWLPCCVRLRSGPASALRPCVCVQALCLRSGPSSAPPRW